MSSLDCRLRHTYTYLLESVLDLTTCCEGTELFSHSICFPCSSELFGVAELPSRVPISGCSDKLLATDGHKVKAETQTSSRYQLLGRLDEGDVSLTIVNVTEEDAGMYGCRVKISGLSTHPFCGQQGCQCLVICAESKTLSP
uniref:Immunoglobulin V-set domain-containing protein n=1 Tax=Oryzias latipes TaxID=8090 RepID=A0A3B3HLQ8_ORYLA